MSIKAKDLMSSPAITVGADTPIRQIATIMRENHISGVPVVNDGKLVGIVTEMHLIARNAPVIGPSYIPLLSGLIPVNFHQYRRYREQLRQVLASTAGELMSDEVKSVAPDTELGTIIGLMENPEIIQLPVVQNDQVVGVVTRTDLVRLIEELEMAPEMPETPSQ